MFRRIAEINKTYKNFNRFTEIIAVLIKYEFRDFIENIGLSSYIQKGRDLLRMRGERVETGLSKYQRIRLAFEELGTTFIKLGQILASRHDVFPVDFIEEMKKLQTEVPSFSAEKAREIIETELGRDIDDVFSVFDKVPVSSASIAQVHIGVLKNGKKVALKVQRPDIAVKMKADIEIIYFLATLIQKYIEEISFMEPVRIVEYFSQAVMKELDFLNERNNIERFQENFDNDENIYVPRVFKEYSSERLLVMEFISGVKLSEEKSVMLIDGQTVAYTGGDCMARQIFEYGFFHTDPHAGNIFIIDRKKVCFIDYGSCANISPFQKDILREVIVGVVERDQKRITTAFINFETDENIDTQMLEDDIALFLDRYTDRPLHEIRIRDILGLFSDLLRKYRLSLPPVYFMLLKSLITVEGIGRDLDPEFDIMTILKPHAGKIIWDRMNPINLGREAYKGVINSVGFLRSFPVDAQDLMKRLKRGNLKIPLELKNQDKILFTFDRVSNRIAFAIILGSIILGSSIIVVSGIPPKIYDVPLIGIVGFAAAAIMGIILMISIIRNRRF